MSNNLNNGFLHAFDRVILFWKIVAKVQTYLNRSVILLIWRKRLVLLLLVALVHQTAFLAVVLWRWILVEVYSNFLLLVGTINII